MATATRVWWGWKQAAWGCRGLTPRPTWRRSRCCSVVHSMDRVPKPATLLHHIQILFVLFENAKLCFPMQQLPICNGVWRIQWEMSSEIAGRGEVGKSLVQKLEMVTKGEERKKNVLIFIRGQANFLTGPNPVGCWSKAFSFCTPKLRSTHFILPL